MYMYKLPYDIPSYESVSSLNLQFHIIANHVCCFVFNINFAFFIILVFTIITYDTSNKHFLCVSFIHYGKNGTTQPKPQNDFIFPQACMHSCLPYQFKTLQCFIAIVAISKVHAKTPTSLYPNTYNVHVYIIPS